MAKSAFVFDTNFIIQQDDLRDVIRNLDDRFSVYVTQVSIDERIAQKCREMKSKFDKISSFQEECRDLVAINPITTYADRADYCRKSMQRNYDAAFGSKVIPLVKDKDTFCRILERAHQKLPPFSAVENASDKGFKDTLIWISMLEFFKTRGETSVLFVTSDNGFRNSAKALCDEFSAFTKKTIEIKDNTHYKELIDAKPKKDVPPDEEKLPEVGQLRDQIRDIFDAFRYVETADYFGDTSWENTFSLNRMLDANDVASILDGLETRIAQHLFDQSVLASQVFGLDQRVSDGSENIPLSALEKAKRIHDEIKKTYPAYTQQFYSTVAGILNQNYVAPEMVEISEDDLPF